MKEQHALERGVCVGWREGLLHRLNVCVFKLEIPLLYPYFLGISSSSYNLKYNISANGCSKYLFTFQIFSVKGPLEISDSSLFLWPG